MANLIRISGLWRRRMFLDISRSGTPHHQFYSIDFIQIQDSPVITLPRLVSENGLSSHSASESTNSSGFG